MTGTGDWIAVLSALASIALALIGFSGLLIALRSANEPLSRVDVVNIRILLIFSLGALIFALLPLPFLEYSVDGLWHPLTVLIALFLLFWPFRTPVWNRQRGVKPQRPLLYWSIFAVQGLLGLALLVLAALGQSSPGLYAAGVTWCLVVAIVTFVAHVFSLLPIDKG